MKVLLDHCVPRPFRRHLPGHDVSTAQEMDWADLDNGDLLAAAAAGQFDAFVTVDQNVQFQHNLAALPLPVIILVCRSNRPEALRPYAPAVEQALAGLSGRPMIRIEPDLRIEQVTPGRPTP